MEAPMAERMAASEAATEAASMAPAAGVPQDADVPRASFWERRGDVIIGAVGVVAFFAAWQWLADSGRVNLMFTSSPKLIAQTFVRLVSDGTLQKDIAASTHEFLLGYGLAVAVGVPLGVAIGWCRPLKALFNPFISGLYATPHIALMPLMIIWLGIGLWSKVAIVFLGAVFPLIINMETAMGALDEGLLKASRSFGASRWQVFKTIAMPASVPYLISGLRLALGHSLVGVVVGEMAAAVSGIGYLITVAGATFRTAEVFVGVAVLAVAGITLNAIFLAIERRFDAWRPKNRS